MAAHHRPLVTSAVAGGLLCALWFVPTAKATHEETEPAPAPSVSAPHQQGDVAADTDGAAEARTVHGTADGAPVPAAEGGTEGAGGTGPQLADTGGIDTTPYLTGGLGFLVVGAGFVAHSVRRARTTTAA